MFFLETTKIIKATIIISVSRLLYLTDPIHSTKRYNNLNGFRDILGFICPTRGLLEGPGLDSDTFIIRELSGNYPGIIQDLAALAGLAGLARRSQNINKIKKTFRNINKYNQEYRFRNVI